MLRASDLTSLFTNINCG